MVTWLGRPCWRAAAEQPWGFSPCFLLIPVHRDPKTECCVVCGLVTKSCPTLENSWRVACQAPLSMGLPRQECWSGLPFPSSGDLPNPGNEPGSPVLQADSLPTELSGKPAHFTNSYCLHQQFSNSSPKPPGRQGTVPAVLTFQGMAYRGESKFICPF